MIEVWITDHVRHATVFDMMDIDWNGPFVWTRWDGNFGCDCNRGQFWDYAHGEEYDDEADDERNPCGHERYAVTIIDPATRAVLYQDVTT